CPGSDGPARGGPGTAQICHQVCRRLEGIPFLGTSRSDSRRRRSCAVRKQTRGKKYVCPSRRPPLILRLRVRKFLSITCRMVTRLHWHRNDRECSESSDASVCARAIGRLCK